MDVTVWRDGRSITLHFERGENVGGLSKKSHRAAKDRHPHPLEAGSGRVYRHRHVPVEYYTDVLKPSGGGERRDHVPLPQPGGRLSLKPMDFFMKTAFSDYVAELAGEERADRAHFLEAGAPGPGPGGQAGIQGEAICAPSAFPTECSVTEYYHNSSWLEHGGAPEKAAQVRLCLRH